MRFAHVNLIARDWRRLARFYSEVFGCREVPPRRRLAGTWLDRGTGLSGANLEGVHLRLPGHGDVGPTLEIFTFGDLDDVAAGAANRTGFGHVAFEVDDVHATVDRLVASGGALAGEVTRIEVAGAGTVTFVYTRDPEGNMVEIQSWRQATVVG